MHPLHTHPSYCHTHTPHTSHTVTLLTHSRFTDKLTIVISHGVSFTVELSAEGRGTTIVSHPPLQPSVDLGPHFSSAPCQHQFTLTNRYIRRTALNRGMELSHHLVSLMPSQSDALFTN